MMLLVLVIAVALTGLDGWRRTQNATSARAEFTKLLDHWNAGVIATDEVIEASQRAFEADRRQWFSSIHKPAIVDSHILRLTRLRDRLHYLADMGLHASEEDRAAALRRVDDVSRLIEEAENR